MSNSVWPHRLHTARLFCPWDSPGKNTVVGCHFLLQGIFLTQRSNPGVSCLPALAGGFFTTNHWCHLGCPLSIPQWAILQHKMKFQLPNQWLVLQAPAPMLSWGPSHLISHCKGILYHLRHQGRPINITRPLYSSHHRKSNEFRSSAPRRIDERQIYISYHKSQYHKNEIETAYDFIVYEFSKTFRENQDLFFGKICLMKSKSRSIMSNSLWPRGL